MSYYVDGHDNPHVNYEPSMHGGLQEAPQPGPVEQGPEYHARLTRAAIGRENDYQQASDRYWTMMDWERDDLVANLVTLLSQSERDVQERMVWHLFLIDDDYGSRVGNGLGISAEQVSPLQPLPGQNLTAVDRKRLANLGQAGRRPLTGEQITGSVHVMTVSEAHDSEAAALLGVNQTPTREAATAASH